jgi:hypothetical protein
MATAKEYRQQAKECLDLAKAAKDLYAKEASGTRGRVQQNGRTA